MNTVVVGVGSNISPRENIAKAKDITAVEQRLLNVSDFVETEPLGGVEQPSFLNGAFLIETEMDQVSLKSWLTDVEERLGRERKSDKWGPRTIDLDIVVYNGEVVDEDFYRRDFLRYFVFEVQPGLELTDEQWKKALSIGQYRILRQGDTEPACCSHQKDPPLKGFYICAGCGNRLFDSSTKYDSGTGWPSFNKPLKDALLERRDTSHGLDRAEVVCARCLGHLGHVFDDGPAPTKKRYCINSKALVFRGKAHSL